MEKIVYILGAGFSAPLGLPVMSNFLEKSKEMFIKDEKYKSFREIFNTIEKLSIIKNYYSADLFNIEEILSIIEMENFVSTRKVPFEKYIKDVIEYYTPNFDEKVKYTEEDRSFIGAGLVINRDVLYRNYLVFYACLHNLIFLESKKSHRLMPTPEQDFYMFKKNEKAEYKYSIITLNYDRLAENSCDFFNKYFSESQKISFFNSIEGREPSESPLLAKLHGCISSEIIPPTWNKRTSKPIKSTWANAYKALCEANYIRILGYSLPITDSYVRYLFKSSIIKSFNLKGIDILCLDSINEIKDRYCDFIKFNKLRFINKNIEEYLTIVCNKNYLKNTRGKNNELFFDKLEEAHEEFFKAL